MLKKMAKPIIIKGTALTEMPTEEKIKAIAKYYGISKAKVLRLAKIGQLEEYCRGIEVHHFGGRRMGRSEILRYINETRRDIGEDLFQ